MRRAILCDGRGDTAAPMRPVMFSPSISTAVVPGRKAEGEAVIQSELVASGDCVQRGGAEEGGGGKMDMKKAELLLDTHWVLEKAKRRQQRWPRSLFLGQNRLRISRFLF